MVANMPSKMIRFNLETSSDTGDIFTDFLLGLDAQGVSMEDTEGDTVLITALFPVGTDMDGVVDNIRDYEKTLMDISGGKKIHRIHIEEIDHSSWDIWKKMLSTVRISPGIVIRPPWEDYTPTGDEIVIEINPSLAFGTGHHETTRNCLIAIEEICREQRIDTVVDVGCGSGVLGIAAVKMGAGKVIALDNDFFALSETVNNISVNHVTDRFMYFCGTIDNIPGTKADLVIANISFNTIRDMEDRLFSSINKNGFLVISGIPVSAENETKELVTGRDMKITDVKVDGDWLTLILRNKTAA